MSLRTRPLAFYRASSLDYLKNSRWSRHCIVPYLLARLQYLCKCFLRLSTVTEWILDLGAPSGVPDYFGGPDTGSWRTPRGAWLFWWSYLLILDLLTNDERHTTSDVLVPRMNHPGRKSPKSVVHHNSRTIQFTLLRQLSLILILMSILILWIYKTKCSKLKFDKWLSCCCCCSYFIT